MGFSLRDITKGQTGFLRVLFVAILLGGFPSISIAQEAAVHHSTFEKGLEGWSGSGEGLISHTQQIGNRAPGAVAFSCARGQVATLSHKFSGLSPGRYMVRASLRALEVQRGTWDYSIWIFNSASGKTDTVVKNLKGSFEWSDIAFTIDVAERDFHIWFRLKAAGTFWLDDVTVTPTKSEPIAYQFSKSDKEIPEGNRPGTGTRCERCYYWTSTKEACGRCATAFPTATTITTTRDLPQTRSLLDFEADDKGELDRHYIRAFSEDKHTSGSRSAVVRFGGYNNVRMDNPGFSDWSGYDYIALDVYNPTSALTKFALIVNDTSAGGHWNQLNHYSMLAQGWNRLRFNLKRYVGERGSVRYRRYVDLARITKFWFSVGPEVKPKLDGAFLVDNVRLEQASPAPQSFDGLHLFDFVAGENGVQPGFTGIMERHLYHPKIGFGFVKPQIWQSTDDKYADRLNRDGIYLDRGRFVVDLPNGSYTIRLNPYHLGTWFEHFWLRRKLIIENRVVLDEKRETIGAYLADQLRFEDVEPEPGAQPFDRYLEQVFAPIETTVEVRDGQLTIEVDGDRTGVCLNWLAVYPTEKADAASQYFAALKHQRRDDFSELCREVGGIAASAEAIAAGIRLLPPGSRLRPGDPLPAEAKAAIDFTVLPGQRPYQSIGIRAAGDVQLKASVSELVRADGVAIAGSADWLRFGVNQYRGHTFNHETYELLPCYLKPLPADGIPLAADFTRMLWLQIPVDATVGAGTYRGSVSILAGSLRKTFPISVTVRPDALPRPDLSVGFFGLMPYTLNGARTLPGVDAFQQKVNRQVLEMLHARGFNTWSGLPRGQLKAEGDGMVYENPVANALMRDARALGFRTAFTYGGGLDEVVREHPVSPFGKLGSEAFRKAAGRALEQEMKENDWLPVIFNHSDEASGYSLKVEADLRESKWLLQDYPYLRRGGFTHAIKSGEYGYDLNTTFTDGSYSSIDRDMVDGLVKNGKRWGMYNQDISPFANPRQIFGQGLFVARHHGLDHQIEWYLTGSQNYPYYDLDGREYDAMMLYPRSNGEIFASIRFELAASGLEDFRLLMLLEETAESAGAKGAAARAWLDANYYGVDPFAMKGRLSKLLPKHGLAGAALHRKIFELLDGCK